MTQQIINIGALPNDGEGDPLRTAFRKINDNFTELYSTSFYTADAYSVGDAANQVIFQTPVSTFTQGTFQLNSSNQNNQDSQNITLTAAKTNNGSMLKWTGHGTMFNGNAITRYDMDISGANVRILVNPIVDTTLFHFISAQITFTGVMVEGIPIGLNGYPDGDVMSTENQFVITTQ